VSTMKNRNAHRPVCLITLIAIVTIVAVAPMSASEQRISTAQDVAQATWLDANGVSTFFFVFGTRTAAQTNGQPLPPTDGGSGILVGSDGLAVPFDLQAGEFQANTAYGILAGATLRVVRPATPQSDALDLEITWTASGDRQLADDHSILRSPDLGFVTNVTTRGVRTGAAATGKVVVGAVDRAADLPASVRSVDERVQGILQVFR